MKRQYFSCIICFLLLSSIIYSQTDYRQQLNFETDQYELNEQHISQLKSLVDNLQNHGYSELTIVGHTDQDGTNDYNEALSKQRAEATKDGIIALGYDADFITLDWKGELDLLVDSQSSDSKKANRRVTVMASSFDFENTTSLLNSAHSIDKESYAINNTVPQSISCSKGSTLNIPEKAFEFEDGSPIGNENVDIEIKEAFTYADFVAEGLFTRSKENLLETGGMLYINASVSGRPVKLKDGQSIEVLYPIQKVEKGMELFYANNNEDNQIDWQSTSQPIGSTIAGTDLYDFNIDWDELLKFKFDKVERPYLSFSEMSSKPYQGRKPFPPSKPIKPTLENTPIQIGTFNKVLMSKKKKEEIRKEKYEASLRKYDQRMKDYKENYQNYLESLETYKTVKPQREKALVDWNIEVSNRIGAIIDYKVRMKKFHVYAQIRGAINKINANLDIRSNKELLNMFLSTMNSPISLTINEKKLYLKVFGNQTRTILNDRSIIPKTVEFHNQRNMHLFPEINDILKEVKKQQIEEEFAKTGKLDNDDMGRYLTNISQLGWINCDRFLEFEPKMLAQIHFNDDNPDTKYYIIFKDMRSMLASKKDKRKGSHYFSGIPKNKYVKIVGVKLVNDKPQMAVLDYKTSNNNYLDMPFKNVNLEEIRHELNSLESLASN